MSEDHYPTVDQSVETKTSYPLTVETPYLLPKIFLPANSQIPPVEKAPSNSQGSGDYLQFALTEVLEEVTDTDQIIEHHVIAFPELCSRIMQLNLALARVTVLLEPELAALTQFTDHFANIEAIETVVRQELLQSSLIPNRVRDYLIYDGYFGVSRNPVITFRQFMAQVVATFHAVFSDLPFTVLAIDEIAAILKSVKVIVEFFLSHYYAEMPDEDPSHSRVEYFTTSNDDQLPWSELWVDPSEGSDSWTRKIASYRWIVGHHLFDEFTIFCREFLVNATDALEKDEEILSAKFIQKAQQSLRGTTAAMWYACNFPGKIYEGPIRQSMISTETPDGFSGTQNADYNRMKHAKDELKMAIRHRYGLKPEQWPKAIYQALKDFHEVDIEDNEHHILIAVRNAGTDTSLAQKVWQQGLPDGVHRKSAAEVLRDMAEVKRKEFKF